MEYNRREIKSFGGGVLKKLDKRIYLKISILITVLLLFSMSVNIFNRQRHDPIKIAYIARSNQGKSYSDIFNEELIKEFSRKTGAKTEVIRGSYDEIKRLEDIDVFIDFPVPSERDQKIELISKIGYVLYTEDENILKKKTNEKIAILRGDNVLLRKVRMKYIHNNFVFVEDVEEGFEKLDKKEVDAFLTMEDPIYMKNPLRKKYGEVRLEDMHDFDKTMFIAANDPYLERRVKKFIGKFQRDDRIHLEERVSSKLISSQISITEEDKKLK